MLLPAPEAGPGEQAGIWHQMPGRHVRESLLSLITEPLKIQGAGNGLHLGAVPSQHPLAKETSLGREAARDSFDDRGTVMKEPPRRSASKLPWQQTKVQLTPFPFNPRPGASAEGTPFTTLAWPTGCSSRGLLGPPTLSEPSISLLGVVKLWAGLRGLRSQTYHPVGLTFKTHSP